jgi:hypothetical protein
MKKTRCAPKIYKKFTENEKDFWELCFSRFLEELYALDGTLSEVPDTSKEVVAHNLACLATWNLNNYIAK